MNKSVALVGVVGALVAGMVGRKVLFGSWGLSQPVRVVLASSSAVKLEAVRAACRAAGLQAVVTGVSAPSGVNEQPLGHEETLRGALNRLRGAKAAVAAAEDAAPVDIVMAIENGVMEMRSPDTEGRPGAPLVIDAAWLVAEHLPTGTLVTAQSGAVEVPGALLAATRALEGGLVDNTVGDLIARDAGAGSNAKDPHALLTAGVQTRAQVLEGAVLLLLGQLQRKLRAPGTPGAAAAATRL